MKRLAAAAAATTLTAGLLGLAPAASAAPACADPGDLIASTYPVDLGVGTKKVVSVDVGLFVHEGCGVEDAAAYLEKNHKRHRVLLHLKETSDGYERWVGTLRLDPRSLSNADAGEWALRYRVRTAADAQTQTDVAQIRRATRLSFDAGPEPIRGERLTFTGTLERASWSSKRYVGVSKPVVVRTYQPEGEEERDVVALTTRANGTFRKTAAVPGPNTYWAVFEGGTVSAPVESRADRVFDR